MIICTDARWKERKTRKKTKLKHEKKKEKMHAVVVVVLLRTVPSIAQILPEREATFVNRRGCR